MEHFKTINPATGEVLAGHSYLEKAQLLKALDGAEKAQAFWEQVPLKERVIKIQAFAAAFEAEKAQLAEQISTEMGKPVSQSLAEIEKCQLLIKYNCEKALEILERPFHGSYLCPLGTLYGIMPWNFPAWQVLRFAIPNLLLGNTILLKPADNVIQSSLIIEEVFKKSLDEGVYQNLCIDHSQSEFVIESSVVKGVSFTGSTRAGKTISTQAGKSFKKVVLELGGNDAYLVLEDADLDLAVEKIFTARVLNAGQSCISAKRIIVHKSLEAAFIEKLTKKVKSVKIGDPLNPDTDMGPLARADLSEHLAKQLVSSMHQGAEVHYQADLPEECEPGYFFPPTILKEVYPGQVAFKEELFGPVFCVIAFEDIDEAFKMANDSIYGLGGAIFSKDEAAARKLAQKKFQTGAVAINDYLRSSPELALGGIKSSGIGREMGVWGFTEFANAKLVL